MIVLLVFGVLLVIIWRRFDLSTSSLRRVVLVALTGGVAVTAGLHLAWWLQPPVNPARWLVILSDALLLFPLVAVVGTDIRVLELLGPVLMALEVSILLLLTMSAVRWVLRAMRHGESLDQSAHVEQADQQTPAP
jgi:ribose/xylose/arabinose/galactoside ABC-type transport system permease subunit